MLLVAYVMLVSAPVQIIDVSKRNSRHLKDPHDPDRFKITYNGDQLIVSMYDLRHLRQQQTKVYFLKDVKQWMQTSNAQTPLTNIQTYKTPPRRMLFFPEDDDDFPDWELNDDTITVANETSVRRYRTCDNLSDTKLECDEFNID